MGTENEQAPDLLLILSVRAETMTRLCTAISYLIKQLNGRFPLWLNGRFLFPVLLSVYSLLQSPELTVTFKGNNSPLQYFKHKGKNTAPVLPLNLCREIYTYVFQFASFISF